MTQRKKFVIIAQTPTQFGDIGKFGNIGPFCLMIPLVAFVSMNVNIQESFVTFLMLAECQF